MLTRDASTSGSELLESPSFRPKCWTRNHAIPAPLQSAERESHLQFITHTSQNSDLTVSLGNRKQHILSEHSFVPPPTSLAALNSQDL